MPSCQNGGYIVQLGGGGGGGAKYELSNYELSNCPHIAITKSLGVMIVKVCGTTYVRPTHTNEPAE